MNKKLLLLPLSALFVFMMAGMASATIDCNASIPNYITRGTELNATFNTTATWGNVSVKFEASGNTPNVSFSVIDSIVSNTSNRLHTNLTFGDHIALFDGTYSFRVTCTANTTNLDTGAGDTESSAVSSTVGGKNVDRGVPTCSFAPGLVSGDEYAPTQKWVVSCINATSATLQFGSNKIQTMAESSDSCTFTGTKSSVFEGSYKTLTAVTSDGLNQTSCSLADITIDIGIPLKQIAALAASGDLPKASSGNSGSNSNNLAWIVIIGLAAFWYVRRKKK